MKKILLATAFLILPSMADAQQIPAPDPVPMKLSRQMIQAIGNALLDAPYKTSAPIMLELQRQLNEADQAAARAAEEAAKAAAAPSPEPAAGSPEKPVEKDSGKKAPK